MKVYRRMKHRPHPQERAPVARPDSVYYIFRWFQEIARGRPVGGMGVLMPVPPSEILAWSTLRHVTVQPWELDAIHGLDAAFLASMVKDS